MRGAAHRIFDLLAEPDKDGNQPPVKLVGSQLIGNKVERIFSSRSAAEAAQRRSARYAAWWPCSPGSQAMLSNTMCQL